MKKEVILPILKFWIYFVILPLLAVILLSYLSFSAIPTLLVDFVLVITPVIYFLLPYQEIKRKTKKRFLIIIFTFIIPYFILYLLFFYMMSKAYEHVSFPL